MINHPNIPKHNFAANIHSWNELRAINTGIELLIVDSSACNDECTSVLDLSSFPYLKAIEVGDYSFSFVNEVKLIGLTQLERVVIGMNSFTKEKSHGHFYLKNCERVRVLKIGYESFSDYSVCEIENVPSLEVIEMGELNEVSFNFRSASLELKSESDEKN